MLREDPSSGPVIRYSGRVTANFGGTESMTKPAVRRHPGRGGAAQGTADSDVFGRAIAVVRRRILQWGTG